MKVVRTGILIKPDRKRVVLKPFNITDGRINKIISRILSLSEKDVRKELKTVLNDFDERHREIRQFFFNRYEQLEKYLRTDQQISEKRKLLIGAYFTNEYSLEAAALFNPSIVWAPDQSGLTKSSTRFILALRAVGEGHISSIVFTSGIINKNNVIRIDRRSKYVTNPNKIKDCLQDNSNLIYEIEYSEDIPLSERMIFPHSSSEINGIEDARFVEFYDENGQRTYYATYTAYDGKTIRPQILETKDFLQFKISFLTGIEVKNKGMALFPRKISGQYVMLSRQDNENIYLMYSHELNTWNEKQLLAEPKYSWEFVQLGNCGSPIETDEGWLVISHSVDAMRRYTIGAFLLDKDDLSKIIGRLRKPLLTANKKEREGYVPNVVYSCGSLVNKGELIIPFAMSDYASSFAKVNLNELLSELKSHYKK
jgi:predicted GH43/DUF377 family glycosyl hydrolase